MLKWFASRLERSPNVRRAVLVGFPIAALIVSLCSVWALWRTARFRDDLIARKYEGSLSENLGFQAVLTSEASRSYDFGTRDEQERTARIRAALLRASRRLAALKPPSSPALVAEMPAPTESISDERTLMQLLASPTLANLPLSGLGLALGTQKDLPTYPFLQTAEAAGKLPSFVFIPAASVDPQGKYLAPKMRRDLVFSKIAERELLDLLAAFKRDQVLQAYYISCADFIRIAGLPLEGQRSSFSPLRSFADRTYFRETRRAPDHFRQSEPYIDVAGGGLINTYSIFLSNDAVGVCGMIGIDRRLQQSFWNRMDLGAALGPLRDFDLGSYTIGTHEIAGHVSRALRHNLGAAIDQRGEAVKSEIQRIVIDQATVFTVPRGEGKIAFFVFNPRRIDSKYMSFFVVVVILLLSFLGIVWLDNWTQRSADVARQSQSEVVANLQGGFVVVDGQDRIVSSNARFQAMVEGPTNGRVVTDFLAPSSVTEYMQLKPLGGFEFAGRVRGRAGVLNPVIITSATLTYDGHPNRRMLMLIDSAQLEQTIAGKFLNIFSHALKSPVHSIILIADLFRRRKAIPKFDRYFAQMQRKVLEFSTLTDNVLRFSALDVKQISPHIRPVNVAKVLRMVLATAQAGAKAQELYLEEHISGNLRTQVDVELLQVVLNNLIDNALKYTLRGAITVHAFCRGTSIYIIVADTGPGVPEEERENIFELFFQGARSGAASREGLGLGLYISRRYVAAMGGSLVYEPVIGRQKEGDGTEVLAGSRFIIELPKYEGGHEDEKEEQDSAA
ncbi:MAG TPA: HAMP domain-containing sensor histidine kinase [Thermoanaerobaculia bacterium]|nr:HAMP domain-containing sensor histidine kinase [Thermoanaerobaculia bacterium]